MSNCQQCGSSVLEFFGQKKSITAENDADDWKEIKSDLEKHKDKMVFGILKCGECGHIIFKHGKEARTYLRIMRKAKRKQKVDTANVCK